jgi:hypothetical protein
MENAVPSEKTIVAKPLPDTLSKEEKKQTLEEAKKTLKGALEVLNDPDLDENLSLDDFVKKIGEKTGREGLTKEDYERHIAITERGKSIILKRTVKERCVNNYNREMITAWNANMDIQLALDPFAVITYIVNYVNKDVTGLTKFMKEAVTRLPANAMKK